MITVTQDWLDYFGDSTFCLIRLDFTLSNGVGFSLYSNNVGMGSLSISESLCFPGNITIGNINSTRLDVSLINKEQMFSNIDFKSASVLVNFYIPSGDEISRGKYYVDSAEFHGNKIDIVAYDALSISDFDLPNLNGYSLNGKTASTVLTELLANDYIDLDLSNLPNSSITMPNITVGGQDSPVRNDITKRELAQYVLELCGGGIKCNNSGDYIIAYSFPLYDFTDDLDGGTFLYTDGDNEDGGLFLKPFATDYAKILQGSWNVQKSLPYTTTFAFTGDAKSISCYVTATGNYTVNDSGWMDISPDIYLPVGTYFLTIEPLRFAPLPHDDTFAIQLKNTTNGESYIANSVGVMVPSNKGTDKYRLQLKTLGYTGQYGAYYNIVHLTNYAWMGRAGQQQVWEQTKNIDGGYFYFWDASPQTVYSLSKLMEYPVASDRKIVTGVRISGSNIETVEAGDTTGEVIEIADNPIITTKAYAQTIANNVIGIVGGINYCEFNASWFADPRFEDGDIVSCDDGNGNTIISMCTGIDYSHENVSNISCVK